MRKRQRERETDNFCLSPLLLFYKPGNEEKAVFVFCPHHFPLDFITVSVLTLAWRQHHLCVCVCVHLSLFEKNGGKGGKMLPVTPSTPVIHLSSPLSLLSHSTPLHFPRLPYFVFQWTFIALLNLNPPLSPCTAYSPLPSDSLFTFPISIFFNTNHQFSLTPLLYSITHCYCLLPLCVVGHHCVLFSLFI